MAITRVVSAHEPSRHWLSKGRRTASLKVRLLASVMTAGSSSPSTSTSQGFKPLSQARPGFISGYAAMPGQRQPTRHRRRARWASPVSGGGLTLRTASATSLVTSAGPAIWKLVDACRLRCHRRGVRVPASLADGHCFDRLRVRSSPVVTSVAILSAHRIPDRDQVFGLWLRDQGHIAFTC